MAASPVVATIYSEGTILSNADLATIHDSVVDSKGWQQATYGDINAQYVLSSAYLVFFMHCGFAMLSIGCVRTRFAKHIAILILVDAAASAVGYYLTGYAFAWGDNLDGDGVPNGNYFIGTNYFALHNLGHDQFYLWVFQWSFAATACTIVSGAIAERARFEAYILYSLFMAAWVYPVLTHSVWSGSGWAGMLRNNTYAPHWLVGVGAIDFAGSGAVHMVGGFAAAAGCWIIGPRIGRYLPDGTVVDMPGHNSSLFVLGVMILWFGWYGFNPGSQLILAPGGSGAVANAALTTTLAPAVASLSALLTKASFHKFRTGRWSYDIMVMGNGALAGLVAITAGCSTVYPWGAIVIGLLAGPNYCVGSWVSTKLHLDDPLDAIAVHAWNGSWGVLAVGFLAGKSLIVQSYGFQSTTATLADGSTCVADITDPNHCPVRQWGCWLGGDGTLLGAQIIYMLWLAGWVFGNMIPFFYLLKVLNFLRVPAEDETLGLDASMHGGHAYPGSDDHERSMSGKSGKELDIANGNHDDSINHLKGEMAELKAAFKAMKMEQPGHKGANMQQV